MPGKGELMLSGSLGDVIQESAKLAFSWVRANSSLLGVSNESVDVESKKWDLHIHVPGGAVPKDGPSAGVALLVSIVSLLLNKSVPSDIGMTGEISLRGLVLPVGGIKEKLIAAHRAGLKTVILPDRNHRDIDWEVPRAVKEELDIQYAITIWDVLQICFPDKNFMRKLNVWKERHGVTAQDTFTSHL